MSEFVSLPKFLRLASEQGLDVSERTLNFYITRNLLPKPVRKPFVGRMDGWVICPPIVCVSCARFCS